MTTEQLTDLEEWVRRYLDPMEIRTINYSATAYRLKHIAEKMIERYVSKEEMEECLEFRITNRWNECYYYALSKPKLNYLEKISRKF